MKTYEEMAKYVLEVRDEHDRKRKHRIAAAKRVIPAAAGICGALIIGFGVFKGFKRPDTLPVHDNIIESETTSAQVTTIPQTTKKSAELTTVMTATRNSSSETTVSESKVTTVKTEVTSETSSKQTSSAAASSSAERTTAATSVPASATSVTSKTTTVTTQETTTTIATGGGGLSGGSSHDIPGGTGGAGGEGNGGDGNGGYAGGGSGGGSGGSTGEQLPINQQYCFAFIEGDDNVYINLYMISREYVGAWIGRADMIAGQLTDGQEDICTADVYFVNGCSDAEAVAIKFDDHEGYYLYYSPNADVYKITRSIPTAE